MAANRYIVLIDSVIKNMNGIIKTDAKSPFSPSMSEEKTYNSHSNSSIFLFLLNWSIKLSLKKG